MTYKYQRLKDTIIDKGFKLEYIARVLGISPITLNLKIKGTCPFKLPEIYKIIDTLELKKENIFYIFFELKKSWED